MDERLAFSHQNRNQFLREAKSNNFDLLVIGGGITGAGIALDAVTRGLSVCLVEKSDFASGTSSRSTKLIHGGLRYLKQFEFNLVKEVGRERAVLHHLAPHLVVPEKMVLPLIKGGSLGKTMTSIGLYIYDFLADVEREDKRRMLEKDEMLEIEPLLPTDKLLGGSIYAEYRTDDARLTIEVIKTGYRHGALPINYLKCVRILEDEGLIIGVECVDQITGDLLSINAKNVINAAGPWVDQVRAMVETISGKRLYLTKGVHIVVPKEKLPLNHAVYFDVPNDNRMIFAIPRLGVTYIGTTDTYYESDKDHVTVDRQDVEYLLNAVNQTFSVDVIQCKDIVSSWAGLRPLIYEDGKSASEISRRDEIFEAENGLLSIAGGKLTGYRKMGERIVDMVIERMYPEKYADHPSRTEDITLKEDSFENFPDCEQYTRQIEELCSELGLGVQYGKYLVHNYGKDASAICAGMSRYASLPPDSALVLSELDFCVNDELVVKPLDYLMRRTGRLFFMPETIGLVQNLIFQYFTERLGFEQAPLDQEKLRWEEVVRSIKSFNE